MEAQSVGYPLIVNRSSQSIANAIQSHKVIGSIEGDVFIAVKSIISNVRSLIKESKYVKEYIGILVEIILFILKY